MGDGSNACDDDVATEDDGSVVADNAEEAGDLAKLVVDNVKEAAEVSQEDADKDADNTKEDADNTKEEVEKAKPAENVKGVADGANPATSDTVAPSANKAASAKKATSSKKAASSKKVASAKVAPSGLPHFQGRVWLGPAFSTDTFVLDSNSTKDPRSLDDDDDDQLFDGRKQPDVVAGVHNVEICCVRCSDSSKGDVLIFALDLMGTVSFWHVLELASMRSSQVKLALQGSLSLADESSTFCGFLNAYQVCILPQQQAKFVVI